MKLHFSPMRRDDALTLEREGDVLIVNGERFDFTPLADGARLPAVAVKCDWILGAVQRGPEGLEVTLALPHGPEASQEQLFPAPVTLTQDGPVPLPGAQTET